jgi:hypothetical protein
MLTCWVEFALGAWEGAAAGGIGHRRVELTWGEMAGPRANSRRVRDDAANALERDDAFVGRHSLRRQIAYPVWVLRWRVFLA